ncbi:hypothetical protein [Actinoplanes sp. NPDC049599]|uniref:hypothetical protein n=1 Tax=Actinoplanes sp. NPDC049599 TaxID=3363903 RepID=UPI0037A57719
MAESTGAAPPGFFPELRDLQRDAAVLAGKLQAAETAAAEASGRDPSEQVRVLLAALGRIASVEVEPQWRSRISPGELGAAVLAAYQEAGRRRVETWAAEIGRPDTGTQAAHEPHPQVTVPAGAASPESIRRLWYLLQDATDRLDDVVRDAQARSRAVTSGRDPGGHVTVSLTGGELTALTLDEEWAAKADGRAVGTALTRAVADGYALVDEQARQSADQWPFPDLDRLSGSPAALLATLGLSDDSRQE